MSRILRESCNVPHDGAKQLSSAEEAVGGRDDETKWSLHVRNIELSGGPSFHSRDLVTCYLLTVRLQISAGLGLKSGRQNYAQCYDQKTFVKNVQKVTDH